MTLDEFRAMHRAWRKREGLPPYKRDVPQCGARCRDGHLCQARAVRDEEGFVINGRCWIHGGLSTGPRTTKRKRTL